MKNYVRDSKGRNNYVKFGKRPWDSIPGKPKQTSLAACHPYIKNPDSLRKKGRLWHRKSLLSLNQTS